MYSTRAEDSTWKKDCFVSCALAFLMFLSHVIDQEFLQTRDTVCLVINLSERLPQ